MTCSASGPSRDIDASCLGCRRKHGIANIVTTTKSTGRYCAIHQSGRSRSDQEIVTGKCRGAGRLFVDRGMNIHIYLQSKLRYTHLRPRSYDSAITGDRDGSTAPGMTIEKHHECAVASNMVVNTEFRDHQSCYDDGTALLMHRTKGFNS